MAIRNPKSDFRGQPAASLKLGQRGSGVRGSNREIAVYAYFLWNHYGCRGALTFERVYGF